MASVPEIFKNMDYGSIKESSSLAEEWAKNKKLGPFINGEFTPRASENAGENITDPYTGKILFNIQIATVADVDRAVTSCMESSHEWKTQINHANYLTKIAGLIEKHGSLLAQAESLSRNVQLKDPRDVDVPALVRWFKYYQGWATLSTTELVNWQPYGTVAAVTACNSPLIALAWLVVPALAAGNTVCLVTSPKDALPALLLANICMEAGLPLGVLNVLPGEQDTINHLVCHNDIMKITSYGPTAFVQEIKQTISDFPSKKLSMIMTGKTPMLVFDTADLDSAVDCAVQSAWYNQGLVPWSVKTLLIQESVFNAVVNKLKKRLSNLRFGTAFDKMADIGRSNDLKLVANLANVVAEARRNGIEVFQIESVDRTKEFICPTILIGSEGKSNLVFGYDDVVPVIAVIPFRTAKEAVALANNSRYGFAASVWSGDTDVSMEVADQLQVGTVWINNHGVMDPAVPVEGWKASGDSSFGGKCGFMDNVLMNNMRHVLSQPAIDKVRDTCSELNKEPAKLAYKLYYGGAYKNADGNATRTVYKDSKPCATIADANRKDVRNAVEAALKALPGWSSTTASNRAQVLYNMSGKLSASSQKLASHLDLIKDSKDIFYGVVNSSAITDAKQTVSAAIHRLNYWAAVCDKTILSQAERSLTNMTAIVTREALGVVGIGVYGLENELRLFDELIWPAICYGNCVVLVIDSSKPTGCLELFQAISDALPAGVVNILTGNSSALLTTVAEHQNVNAILHFHFPNELAKPVHIGTLHNMKRIIKITESDFGIDPSPSSREFYEMAMTRGKSIWINKGDMFAN